LKVTSLIFLILLLANCSNVDKRVNIALDIAAKNNFKNFVFNTKNYQIFSAQRLIYKNQIINIYIEGDGRSWIDRDTISSNPTPVVPFALNLANLDADNNVIYLARPCQYAFNQKCNESVWTSHQFSKPVLMSYMEVLDTIKEQNNNNKFNLIAYSGGATIALMLGANREDIQSIRTIAGNLDHNELSKITKTSPLTHSVAAKEFIFKTEKIPQIHYHGNKDEVIPNQIYLNYQNSFAKTNCVKIVEVEGFKHTSKDWESFWKKNQSLIPTCN
jgi:hypothetical protein